MTKKLLLTLLMVVGLVLPAAAQVTVPNTLVAGTTITAAGLNTNFTTIANHALDRLAGGTISGNIAVDAGITIDGVDVGVQACVTCTPTLAKLTLTNTSATSLTVGGGITVGTGVVALVSAAGQIPAISSTYFASLSGANLTALVAGNITAGGTLPALTGTALTALNASNLASGTTGTARGGTGLDGSAAANGRVLIGNGSGYTLANLTAGAGTTITNGSGSITIANNGTHTLLKQGSGTSTNAGVTSVDTVAISGLTAKDTLIIYYAVESATQDTALTFFYNSTDSIALTDVVASAVVTAGSSFYGTAVIFPRPGSLTSILSTARGWNSLANVSADAGRRTAFTTNWTGSWTLDLRHNGVTGGGTFSYTWVVYKLAGQ